MSSHQRWRVRVLHCNLCKTTYYDQTRYTMLQHELLECWRRKVETHPESGTVWFAALQGFSQQGQCYWPLPCLNACDQWKRTVRNETNRFNNVKDLGHPQTSRISAFKQLSRTHLWQLRMSSHPKGNKPISALGHNCQKQKSLLLIPFSMNHHKFIFKPVRSDVNAKPGRVWRSDEICVLG